ncbi:MAG: hypothetical protein V1765_00780 [bacterium]
MQPEVKDLLQMFVDDSPLEVDNIKDIPGLIVCWNNNAHNPSAVQHLAAIENQLAIVFSRVTIIIMLIQYWEQALPNSKPRELAEKQIATILRNAVDGHRYIEYLSEIPENSRLANIFESCLFKTLTVLLEQQVSKDHIPQWYINDIKRSDTLPSFYADLLKRKAQELLEQL